MERVEPSADQSKAVASPLRLRILRLCDHQEVTNKELADRLDRDPSTILHHVRLLEKAGLIESVGVRQGPSGAYEKPYRSTRLTRRLSFDLPQTDDEALPMLDAFNDELAEAGHQSIAQLTTFHLHLEEEDVARFIERYLGVLEEFVGEDDERRENGAPEYGGIVVLHRMASEDS
jgi:DNA-binding transcriptional ArsR family regulator